MTKIWNNHQPTLYGPNYRLWLKVLQEAKEAGIDIASGEAAFMLVHDDDHDLARDDDYS